MPKLSKVQQRLRTPADERKPNVSFTPKAGTVAAGRDVPENNFWDVAEQFYQTAIAAVGKTHGQLGDYLNQIVNDDKLYERIKDNNGLLENIQLLTRDIVEHLDRLNTIHSKHADRTGGTKSPDDHALVIQIHGLYADAQQIYEANMMPTVTHIFEQIGVAEQALELERQSAQAKAKEQATDTSVVTDVQPKEAAAS